MTTTTTQLAEVLNDLIRINYDRIEGYRKAAEDSKVHDIELHPVFQKMADVSRLNVSALTEYVRELGAAAESGTTTMGRIYHGWMEVKATFTGKDRGSILAACEFGEDQAQKAYHAALSSDPGLDEPIRQLIMSQKEILQMHHDLVKELRDKN